MAGQFGGGSLQGVPLPGAGGSTQQSFTNMVVGCVAALYFTITFSLLSTAGAFALVISTASSMAAEGVDDADIIAATIFRQLLLQLDAKVQVGALTTAQWRSILGYLNQRDWVGSLMLGGSVPASNTSPDEFTVTMKFPMSLAGLFDDGGIFRQGSDRLRNGGYLGLYMNTPAGTAVLANGSAVISAVSEIIDMEAGAGLPSDIGPAWTALVLDGVPTKWPLGGNSRIGAFAAVPVPSNPVGSYNLDPLWSAIEPSALGAKYVTERLAAGGADITNRMTPLYWIERQRTFADFAAGLGEDFEVQALSGVSDQDLYDLPIETVGATTAAQVATQVGGGGNVATAPVAPKSMQASGGDIPPQLAALAPIRFVPAAFAMGGNTASPAKVANMATVRQVNRSKNTGARRLVRGR